MMLANLFWLIVQSTWFWLLTSLKMISASRLRNVNTVLLTSVVTKIDHSEMPFRQYRLREIFGRKYEERGQLCSAQCAHRMQIMFSTQLQCLQIWKRDQEEEVETFTRHGFKLLPDMVSNFRMKAIMRIVFTVNRLGTISNTALKKNTQLLSRCWTKCKNVPFGQYLSK